MKKKKKLKMIAAIEMKFWGVYGKPKDCMEGNLNLFMNIKKINLDDDELYNKLLDKHTIVNTRK